MTDTGRFPDGSGSRASHEAASASSPKASIPNAAEDRILAAVKRALTNLNDPTMNWQEYHRRLQRMPDLVLHEIREAKVLFRLPEQADWPLLIEAYEDRPYSLTIRTQMTVGKQTLGFDQRMDDRLLYTRGPLDRDLAVHMGKHAIRAMLEAVAEPFYAQAAIQFASAIEAHRGETAGLDAQHESAAPKVDAQPLVTKGETNHG